MNKIIPLKEVITSAQALKIPIKYDDKFQNILPTYGRRYFWVRVWDRDRNLDLKFCAFHHSQMFRIRMPS